MQFLEPRQISKSIGRRKGPRRCIGLHISSRRRCASAVIRCRCGWQSGAVHDAICASPLRPVSPPLCAHPPGPSRPPLALVVAPPMQGLRTTREEGGGIVAGWELDGRVGEGWRDSQGPRRALILLGHGPDFSLFSLSLDNYFLLSSSTSPSVSSCSLFHPHLLLPFRACSFIPSLSSPLPLPPLLSFSLFHSFPSFLPCTPIIAEPFRREYGLSSDWRASLSSLKIFVFGSCFRTFNLFE